jgi:hypothetical protein
VSEAIVGAIHFRGSPTSSALRREVVGEGCVSAQLAVNWAIQTVLIFGCAVAAWAVGYAMGYRRGVRDAINDDIFKAHRRFNGD